MDYIKRVVGLPGDRVEYRNKRLTINGEKIALVEDGEYLHPERLYYSPRFREKLGDKAHSLLIEPDVPPYISNPMSFPHRENCTYTSSGISCVVPEGHYFALGDNRDASSDSRVWGFIPDENIVGRAFFIWFNSSFISFDFSNLKRLGGFH